MSGLLARSDFAGRGRQHAAVDDDGLAGDPASGARRQCGADAGDVLRIADASQRIGALDRGGALRVGPQRLRSEEHTSELQSLMRISYAVFCLKKINKINLS